jgi:hypothetical protein
MDFSWSFMPYLIFTSPLFDSQPTPACGLAGGGAEAEAGQAPLGEGLDSTVPAVFSFKIRFMRSISSSSCQRPPAVVHIIIRAAEYPPVWSDPSGPSFLPGRLFPSFIRPCQLKASAASLPLACGSLRPQPPPGAFQHWVARARVDLGFGLNGLRSPRDSWYFSTGVR